MLGLRFRFRKWVLQREKEMERLEKERLMGVILKRDGE